MKRNNIIDLIPIFNKKHDNKYDYTKSIFINNRTKLEIICPLHGSFWQDTNSHIKGHGCPICSNNKKMCTISFINKAINVHGDVYNYDLVDYKNNITPIKILCYKHGVFEQAPSKHLCGRGCPICGGSQVLSKEELERKSKIIHGDLYNYDLVDYKNAKTKVIIKCPKHGEFLQKPNNHLSGYGCLICKSSKGEIIIFNYLTKNKIKFESEYYVPEINCYIDFYIPTYNIGIEFDGMQHFQPIDYFGGEKAYKIRIFKDNLKNKYCLDHDILLHRIPYTEFNKIDSILDKIFK